MDADPSIFADGAALEGPPSDDLVRSVEAQLGVRLPAAYMIALDYRAPGEPSVVHVDQEGSYRIATIAPDFATFVAGLVSEEQFLWV